MAYGLVAAVAFGVGFLIGAITIICAEDDQLDVLDEQSHRVL